MQQVETSLTNPSPQPLPPEAGGESVSEGRDDTAESTDRAETKAGEACYRSQKEVDSAFAKRLAAERNKWAQEADARLDAERGRWQTETQAQLE